MWWLYKREKTCRWPGCTMTYRKRLELDVFNLELIPRYLTFYSVLFVYIVSFLWWNFGHELEEIVKKHEYNVEHNFIVLYHSQSILLFWPCSCQTNTQDYRWSRRRRQQKKRFGRSSHVVLCFMETSIMMLPSISRI